MVVYDVQKHHQLEAMGGVDKLFQLVRRAIGSIRGVREDPIIAPVALTGKIVDRHQLYRRDTQLFKPRQIFLDTTETSHNSNVDFIQDDLRPSPPAPVWMLPGIRSCRDQTGAMHVVEL